MAKEVSQPVWLCGKCLGKVSVRHIVRRVSKGQTRPGICDLCRMDAYVAKYTYEDKRIE